ncbi:hypothetical protein ACLB2K_020856 [Fragaria x ananassa]
MSSPSVFNFNNFAPGEDCPSQSHQVRSRTGSGQNGAEVNPFSSVSDGGHHMDKGNVVSEVCMMKVEGETESEKVETNACNVAKLSGHGNCQACAEFRIKGYEAHCNNDFLIVQQYYTLGIESLHASERSCCLKRLSQCYSDRAAARVSLGRIREDLADALMAIQLDPGYPDDRVRAANCHLLLGEVDHALKYFNECWESETVACLDRRVVIDCVDGIKKAHKVAECTNRSASLLEKRTADAAHSAFGIVSEALCLGRYREALSLVEQVRSMKDKYGSKNMESSMSAADTISELLNHKIAGNDAFKAGTYTEAAEHYTTALSSNIGSRPFAATCLCNCAAAHQALGQIMDAIADCSLAIALDENYGKAVSRRATLHEMIRDYVQAASDVQRLVSILEKQYDDKAKESTTNASAEKLQPARRRLQSLKEKAKKGIPLNFNLILGIKPSDTSSNIKKAYRMAALKHHPDKAGQFLGRSENRDEERLWKEITPEVQKDADSLFKMIGEAYAVLSDPSMRSKYDFEEDMRKAANERKEQSNFRERSDFQSPYRSYRPSDFQSTKRTSCNWKPSYSECPSRSSSYRRYDRRCPFERTCPDER